MTYRTGFMVQRKFRHDIKLDFPFRNPNTRVLTCKPHVQKNMIITYSTKSRLALLKDVKRREEHIVGVRIRIGRVQLLDILHAISFGG